MLVEDVCPIEKGKWEFSNVMSIFPKDMGIVWEAYHKGVPLLGIPGITLDNFCKLPMLFHLLGDLQAPSEIEAFFSERSSQDAVRILVMRHAMGNHNTYAGASWSFFFFWGWHFLREWIPGRFWV